MTKRVREGWIQTVALVGAAMVVGALGVWGAVRAWHSTSVGVDPQPGLATVIGANLLLCLWAWYRARPGSAVASVMPVIALLMAAMLLDKVPRVFWPAAEGIHRAGSIASLFVTTVVSLTQIRRIWRWRGVRRGAALP